MDSLNKEFHVIIKGIKRLKHLSMQLKCIMFRATEFICNAYQGIVNQRKTNEILITEPNNHPIL